MKAVNLYNGEYLYLYEYNLIINKEISSFFPKYRIIRKPQINKCHISLEKIKYNIQNLSQIIFEVTQNCNLSCKYCVYGGNYYYHRNKSTKSLSMQTAKEIVDRLYEILKNKHAKELTISFYGGEPLLEYSLIAYMVDYIRKVFCKWKLKFALTTNGTIIDEDIIDHLSLNNFDIVVSIDGPKNIHDNKRSYVNGNGSFDNVYNNLILIRQKNPIYYQKNVRFLSVISPDLPISQTHKFFTSDDVVNKNVIRTSFVSIRDTKYFLKYPIFKEIKNELKEIDEYIINKIINKQNIFPYEQDIFVNKIKSLEHSFKIRDISNIGSSCLFGERLFIDAAGSYHICNMINNTLPIGNILDGLDYHRMLCLANDLININETICVHCEMKYLCGRCFVYFAKKGMLKYDPVYCNSVKNNYREQIEKYVHYKNRIQNI